MRNRSRGRFRTPVCQCLEERRLLAVRLDDPQAIVSEVASFQVSPDARHLVYSADAEVDHLFELYSVELATGRIAKVNDNLGEAIISEFRISPDGEYVVYKTFQSDDDYFELFAVPFSGRGAVRLSGEVVLGRTIDEFQISGDRVVFRTYEPETNDQLYSASIDDGTITRLNPDLVPGGDVTGFEVTGDGDHVVYLADQVHDDRFELYSVPIAGGAAVRLNPDSVGSGGVDRFRLSDDGSHAVFVTRGHSWGFALYSVPTAGGQAIRLRDEHISSSHDLFAISPDGRYVVYVALLPNETVRSVHSVPIGGGDSIRLVDLHSAFGFEISFDSRNVVFRSDHADQRVIELYRVPITGGDITKLSTTLASINKENDVVRFDLTRDDARVVYHLRHGRLFSVSLADGTVAELAPNSGTFEFRISADESHVIYQAQDSYQLYSVPIDGGQSVRLNQTPNGTIDEEFRVSPDGDHVFWTQAARDNIRELFVASENGDDFRQLSESTLTGGDVRDFVVGPDDRYVVYTGDHRLLTQLDIYSSDLMTTRSIRLSEEEHSSLDLRLLQVSQADKRVYYPALGNLHSQLLSGAAPIQYSLNRRIREVRLSGDGRYVVYPSYESDFAFMVLPTTGGEALRLTPPVERPAVRGAYQIGPNSNYLVYALAQERENIELFSVPLTGGVPTRLNPPLVTDGDVRMFDITPDGTRVVYVADQESGEHFEIYSVAIEGGIVTKLNDELVDGGSVADVDEPFRISADGRHVVYMADQRERETMELFSAPIDGGGSTRLNADMSAGGDVSGFGIGSGGRVVYLADQLVDGTDELFGAQIGGGPVTRLNGDLPIEGDVIEFQIDSAGDTVAYRADQEINDVVELYLASIDGGMNVKLNDSLVDGGDVEQFLISPDGRHVAYSADQDTDEVVELYGVRLTDGLTVKLSDPMVADGEVRTDRIDFTSDGRIVIYRADQDVDGQIGLYAASLDRIDDRDPPRVVSVEINGLSSDPADLPTGPRPTSWTDQRSSIRSLAVILSEEVRLDKDDLILTNLGVRAPTEPDARIDLTDVDVSIDGNLLVLTFDQTRLPQGVYRLEILDSATDLAGNPLDGDGDGLPGGRYVLTGDSSNRFHVLTSDWNGDGGVAIEDFTTFAYWFGQIVPRAPTYVDLNGDGGVSIFDFGGFADGFGQTVVFPAAALALDLHPSVSSIEHSRADSPAVVRRPVERAETLEHDAALLAVLRDWSIRTTFPSGWDDPRLVE